MSHLKADIRQALRGFRKNPGLAVVIILTLALGIGANSAIFSVVRGVLLSSLPYAEPARLLFVWNHFPSTGDAEARVSTAEMADWRTHPEIFEDVAGIATAEQNAIWTLTENGETEVYRGAFATTNLFDVLGVQAALGRTFAPEEGVQGQNDVVVLSDWLWRRRFSADRNIIGRRLTIRGEDLTVIGVMPPGFHTNLNVSNAGPVDLWVATVVNPNSRRESRFYNAVARLDPSVSFEVAEARASVVAAEFRERFPDAYGDEAYTANIIPLHARIVGDVRTPLLVLLGTVAIVLLIATLNVANLLLVRGEARQREVAMRTALGAEARHIIQQFVVESLLLTLVGGALGLLVAYGGIDLLRAFNPGGIPRIDQVVIDVRVVGVTGLLAIGTGVLMGLLPGIHAVRVDINTMLKDGGRSGTGSAGHRLRRVLIVSELALAVVLVIGAGLLVKSFARLTEIRLGIAPDHVLTMRLDLEPWQYPEIETVTATHTQILEEVLALPGVQSVSIAHAEHPLRLNGRWYFDVEGRAVDPAASRPLVGMRVVSPGYLETLRVPLLSGRNFNEFDRMDAPVRILIDETMAERRFPDGDAIGARLIPWSMPDAPLLEVIGVIGKVKNEGLREEIRETMLFPYTNAGPAHPWQRHMTLMVRSASDPAALTSAVRQAVLGVDRAVPITMVQTLDDVVADTIAAPRFMTILSGIFASLALGLAAIGVYGVMSYSVAQRTQEIGVRIALGADISRVQRLVLTQGLSIALVGIAIGVAGALVATRLLSGILYGVSTTDPVTFVGVAVFLVGVALAASYLPARRASTIAPSVALRSE